LSRHIGNLEDPPFARSMVQNCNWKIKKVMTLLFFLLILFVNVSWIRLALSVPYEYNNMELNVVGA
jgi:hypothetical protein